MNKKVLVLTGSPRKGGNSDLLADALIKGAQASGHTAVKFEAGAMQINGCSACDRCWEDVVWQGDANETGSIAPSALQKAETLGKNL